MWEWFEKFYIGNEALCFLLGVFLGFFPSVMGYIKKFRKSERDIDIGFLTHVFVPIRIDETIKDKLQITYKGERIDSIQQSYIRIYNDGKKPLKREDFYGKNMKLLSTGDVLDIEIVNQRLVGGNFSVRKCSEKEYIIDFDFFESKQVIDIRILKKEGDLSLSCEAAGVGSVIKAETTDIGFIVVLCFLVFGCFSGIIKSWNKIPGDWYWYLIISLFTLYFISFACILIIEIKKLLKTPKYLTSFKGFYMVTDNNFLKKESTNTHKIARVSNGKK